MSEEEEGRPEISFEHPHFKNVIYDHDGDDAFGKLYWGPEERELQNLSDRGIAIVNMARSLDGSLFPEDGFLRDLSAFVAWTAREQEERLPIAVNRALMAAYALGATFGAKGQKGDQHG